MSEVLLWSVEGLLFVYMVGILILCGIVLRDSNGIRYDRKRSWWAWIARFR